MTVAREITRKDIALVVGEGDESTIQTFVSQIPAERLAPTILSIRQIRKSLQLAEAGLEVRYGAEVNVPYVDPETRDLYTWSGDAKWSVPDPAGLVSELRKLAAARPAFAGRIHSAFEQIWKFDHRVLNSIRDLDQELSDSIREFRIRSYGPKHLKKWEEPPGQVKQ